MVDSNNYMFSWKEDGILPRVGSQENCSCCVMFACTSLFSSIRKNSNGQIILFSKQQIIDCLPKLFPIGKTDSQGCYETSFSEVLSYVKHYGLCRDYEYSYKGKRSSPYSDAYIEKHKCLITLGEYEIGLESSYPEEHILATIHRNPIMGLIPIFQTLQDFSGNGIYKGREGIEDQKGSHAVLITGYGVENGIKYYEIQNSWGIGWGDRGFARVSRSLFWDLTAVYDIHCKDR